MPSPLGHALGAAAIGWIVAGAPRRRTRLSQTAILVCAGLAPDLDLLAGRHSAETHSIGAAVLAGALAAWMRWPVARTRLRIFLAVAAAWLSHPLLDALGSDSSVPIGVMLFWPLSPEYVLSRWEVFEPISRRWQQAGFIEFNTAAVLREIVLLAPVAFGSWWVSRAMAERAPVTDPQVGPRH